ncbi:MAG: hypothetical protein ABJA67_13190 [Chthonomonadales bacterium]
MTINLLESIENALLAFLILGPLTLTIEIFLNERKWIKAQKEFLAMQSDRYNGGIKTSR